LCVRNTEIWQKMFVIWLLNMGTHKYNWLSPLSSMELWVSIASAEYISSKPFYYYTGSRLGQILHSRLRMQCSSLNQHLYRKNIVDSPNCICGLTESTTHYLFHCLRYTAQRQMYINSINVPINLTTEIHPNLHPIKTSN